MLAGDTDHNNIDGATNYVNWQSTEPGMIIVSTTADDFDGDLELRRREPPRGGELCQHGERADRRFELPSGPLQPHADGHRRDGDGVQRFGRAWCDDDRGRWGGPFGDRARLELRRPATTIASLRSAAPRPTSRSEVLRSPMRPATPSTRAWRRWCQLQAKLDIVDCAIVNNSIYDTEMAVHSMGSDLTILRSVLTNNHGYDGSAVFAEPWGGHNGSLTIGDSIFALNSRYATNEDGATPNVGVYAGVALTNLGNNLYDNAAGGFFNVLSAAGDHLGTPQYVVTTVADTFDHTNDAESLSIREAVDLANQAAGTQEIWIPAWSFVLTRDRGGLTSDVDTGCRATWT